MDQQQQDAMRALMGMKYIPGQGLTKVEVEVDTDFPAQLQDLTRKELDEALEIAIGEGNHAILGQLTTAHVVDIMLQIERLRKEKVDNTPEPIRVSYHKGLPQVDTLNRKTHSIEQKVLYTGGMAKADQKSILKNMLCSSVTVTKSTPTHNARLNPIADVPKKVEQLVPNLKCLTPVAMSLFSKIKGMDDLLEQVSESLEVGGVLSHIAAVARGVIPSKYKEVLKDAGRSRLQNTLLGELTDKHLRARDQILKTIPCADKSGSGYFNVTHYDGIPVRGYQRKVMEFVNDFDFSKSLPVVRLDVTEKSAHALFNAIRDKEKKVLVLYASRTAVGNLSDYFKDSQLVKSGCIRCTDTMFQSYFRDNMDKVYYYHTASPQGSAKFSSLNLLSNNKEMSARCDVLDSYGYYSFYADTRSLLTQAEIDIVCRLKGKRVVVKSEGFAPSCMVRKGLFRVVKAGAMKMSDVFRNCAAGKLHYVTWCFRNYPFSSNTSPGDPCVQPIDNLIDLDHEDEATKMANSVLRKIMENASPILRERVNTALGRELTAPPEQGDDEQGDDEEEKVEDQEEEETTEGMFGGAVADDTV